LVLLVRGDATDAFVRQIAERFQAAPVGTLLSSGVERSLQAGVKTLCEAGARVVAGGTPGGGQGYCHANTLLSVTGRQFLGHAEALQTEAFGNCSLLVLADDIDQLCQVLDHLEGNLTGCVYSDTGGSDDAAYDRIAPRLRQRVGRLLNDKMPTGVAVSPAMNHGGPFPATGHPGFTAVGVPAALRRFAALHCYDNVRPHRLPPNLRDPNPSGAMWRLIDGRWTLSDAGA
jgi:NADP-dependent aldehyde dehydrogenase